MDAVLQGRDSLLVLPTGGGKSLCFQAPALVRDGLALVDLAAHLADEGSGRHARRQRRAGGVSATARWRRTQRATVMAGLREGRYRLLYVAPERLVGEGGGWMS